VLDFISKPLLRPCVIAALVVSRPLLDFFLADTGQRVEQAMFRRRRIRAATSSTCTAFVAVFSHISPFASCFRFVRISRFCHPASPSPLFRARLAFNLATVEPAGFNHRLEFIFRKRVSVPYHRRPGRIRRHRLEFQESCRSPPFCFWPASEIWPASLLNWLIKKRGTPESAPPVLLARERLNDHANPCRRHRHRFDRPNRHDRHHDHLIHLLP
jgi:hypothetical protein